MAERRFRRSSGDISFDDDIILDVAEKLGYSPKKISNVFAAVFMNIRKHIKDPEIHGIYMPNMGHFSFKVEYARYDVAAYDVYKKRFKLSSVKRNRMETLRKQVENFDKIYAIKSQGVRAQSIHKFESCLHKYYIRKNFTLEQLEEFVNSY